MKNSHDALEVLDDMILIVYEKIHTLKKGNSFFSWSKTILVNCCKNRIKQQKRLCLNSDTHNQVDTSYTIDIEDKIDLNMYLSKLKEDHKEIIKLRYFLDMDYNTISELLNIPLGTVKSRLSIAMRKLKAMIGGDLNE